MKNGDFPLLCEFTVEVSLFLDSTGGSLNPAARTGAFERRTKQAYHLELTSRQALVVSQDTSPGMAGRFNMGMDQYLLIPFLGG
jgi:hypothetical protein